MVASCVFFAMLTGVIRHLSATIDPLEIVFFPNLFGIVVMLPWLMRHGLGVLCTRRLPLHAVRALICLMTMIGWFAAVSHMNLSDAVALSFTTPLFATVAAVFVLDEVMCARRCTAVFLSFVGAMIILRPGFQEITPIVLVVLLSAATMAIATTLAKLLARTESTGAIVFYTALFLTPASLIPALFVWRTPTFEELFWLLAVGGAATLCHVCLVRAFALADVTAVLPFDYTRLPLIALVGYFAFGEKLDVWTGVGSAVIMASSVYIAHREAAYQRAVAVPAPRPDSDAFPVRSRTEAHGTAD